MRTAATALLATGLLAGTLPAQSDDFGREGSGEVRTSKNALEGKPPPALQVKDWMNTGGKALSWEDLRGKVVVLDFWGTW